MESPHDIPPATRTLQRTNRVKVLLTVLTVLCLYPLLEWGLNYESKTVFCTRCGASAAVRGVYFFGLGGKIREEVSEGPISKFRQECEGCPCQHAWQFADGSRGFLLSRLDVEGVAGFRLFRVRVVESLPDIVALLHEHQQRDAQFCDSLKAALASGYDPEILKELWYEGRERELAAYNTRASQPNPP